MLNELETVFDKDKAKVLTSVILKQDSLSHEKLVTKADLDLAKSELKNEFHQEIAGLRKEMYQGFLESQKSITDVQKSITDVQKSITRMTIYFISAIGIIATIFKILDILIKP